ncbi:MAG TPA: hypothetical protein VHK91_03975 [Flavisolibacter sp.]|jgi:hypothetical protein|nr:hypothetical protein [Flavisolibacter sp.]
MKIIALSGTPAALPGLNQLIRTHQLCALLCPSQASGSETLPLQHWAEDRHIPCWLADAQEVVKDLTELISEIRPDLILIFGFPFQLSNNLWEAVRFGAWNVHFSLLPDQEGSITIHQLSPSEGLPQVISHFNLKLSDGIEEASPIEQLSQLTSGLLQTALSSLAASSRSAA